MEFYTFLQVLLLSAAIHGLPYPESKYYASNAEIDEYIVNGEDVEKGRWPWQLSLEVLDPEFRHTCGASLLDEQHAMTAAHCLDGRWPDMDFRVVIGASNRGWEDNPGDREDTVNISAAYIHEDYNCLTCPGGFPNDIAIMYLERPTELNEYVQPAVLASPENDEAYENSLCYSSGWGKLHGSDEDVPTQLQEIEIVVLNTTECRDLVPFGPSVQDEHVCIWDARDVPDEEKRGMCQGDSGGPVQCEFDGEWHVLGAASWVIADEEGSTCNPAFPGAYNRASAYRDWIDDVLADDSWKPY